MAAASFRVELMRDCRSATMIPPFSTLPSAAKICSSVYAMFVPPARLGQLMYIDRRLAEAIRVIKKQA